MQSVAFFTLYTFKADDTKVAVDQLRFSYGLFWVSDVGREYGFVDLMRIVLKYLLPRMPARRQCPLRQPAPQPHRGGGLQARGRCDRGQRHECCPGRCGSQGVLTQLV